MTDAEIWELILLSQGNSSATLGIYLSLVSGYLIVAYLVGKDLSRSQVTMISGLFSMGCIMAIVPTYAYLSRATFLLQFADETYKSPATLFLPLGAPVMSALLLLGLLASLKFMWDVRHPKNE